MKTIKYQISVIAFLITLNTTQAQNWLWAKDGGNTPSAGGWHLTFNTNNSIYFSGGFHSSITFDTITQTSGIDGLGFITKHKTDGICTKATWIVDAGVGLGSGFGLSSLNHDHSGNIFLTGGIVGHNIFDTISTFTGNVGFLAKFNSDLSALWVKPICDMVNAATFDKSNNIYVCGTIESDTSHIDTFALYNPHPNPIFNPKMYLAKLDSTGKCLWTKQGYGGNCSIAKVCVNNANVYLYGYVDSCVAFDTATMCGLSNFVIKTDGAGNIKWRSTYTHLKHGYFTSIDVDANSNCYVIGGYDSTMYLSSYTLTKAPNSRDNAFIAKYDSTGTIQWIKQFSSDSLFFFQNLHTDMYGNTYAVGYFSKTAIFGTDTITSQTGRDMFIIRLNSSGDFLGYKIVPYSVDATAITQDDEDNAIVTGSFETDTVYFDSYTLVSIGQSNFFLAKLQAIDGTSSSVRILPDDNRLKIYANPNTGTFTIEVPQGIVRNNNAQVGIYNSTGGVVKEEQADISNNKLRVDIGTVQKGIYTVTLSSGRKRYTGRVVVE